MWLLSESIILLLTMMAESGRADSIAQTVEPREKPIALIAPGPPPLLAFRFFEGQAKHRFGDFDLVVDDANH
jgi:hypothetical protein